MPTANRISGFISEVPPVERTALSSGSKPSYLRIAPDGREPDVPRDLLAKLLTPPADARCRDRRFAVIRQQMIDQFRPTEPAHLMEIDLIASDMLHLASLRQAMELVTAPTLPAEVAASARQVPAQKKLLKALKRLIGRGELCKLFDCPEEQAAMLASRLVAEFRVLRDMVAEAEMAELAAERGAPGLNDPVTNLDEIDSDDPRRRQLLEIIAPIEPALTDPSQAQEVLTGDRPLNPDERIRWVAILKLAAEDAGLRALPMNNAVAKAQAAERAILAVLAQDPVKLAVLHRCAMQFEEAIHGRLRRLRAEWKPSAG